MNDQLDTDYFMAKNKAIYAVENTIKQLHIQKDMHMDYKQDLYKEKQKEIYDFFLDYLVPIMENLDHPALIEERKPNLDADAHEKYLNKDVNLPSIKKKMILMIKMNTSQQA